MNGGTAFDIGFAAGLRPVLLAQAIINHVGRFTRHDKEEAAKNDGD